jgi:hypothetical protein
VPDGAYPRDVFGDEAANQRACSVHAAQAIQVWDAARGRACEHPAGRAASESPVQALTVDEVLVIFSNNFETLQRRRCRPLTMPRGHSTRCPVAPTPVNGSDRPTSAYDRDRNPLDAYGLHWAGPLNRTDAARQQRAAGLMSATPQSHFD